MKHKAQEYTWETRGDVDIWRNETFSTIEECIEDAKDCDVKGGSTIYVGIVEPYCFNVNEERVLEELREQAFNEVGEVASDWPSDCTNEEMRELENALTECVFEWLMKRNDMPSFYKVINIREVDVE